MKNNWPGQENCHATEKSEDVTTCKVILVNTVVDKKIIIGKRGLGRRKATRGR
jgi:hypothetical protein